ncbi:MAG: TetR/AcrR family transcriptional regulator [Anaerolineae bacterium]
MPKIIRDEDVFRAVMQVIIARGYDGATTRQLATAAGISEVTLFRKYGSKAELIRRAVAHIAEEMNFEAVVRYTGDVVADLLRIVERYLTLMQTYGEFMAVLIPEMHRHPELRDAMARPFQVMQAIGELLARYQEEGVLRPEHPLHSAAALLGPLVYFAMARGTTFEAQIPPAEPETHVLRFLEGRQARSSLKSFET